MNAFFTYGTLKRGQERHILLEQLYDETQIEIYPAHTTGQLYDLEYFPALLPGEDRIEGELIVINNENMVDIIKSMLDNMEGYFGPGDERNLYYRDVKEVYLLDGSIHQAYVYLFSRPSILDDTQRMEKGSWP